MARRERHDLGGVWKYTPLAYCTLVGPGELEESVEGLPPPGEMTIPCNWELGGLKNFHGKVRFERSFTAPPVREDQRLFLCFEGVDYYCLVKVNGRLVGSHEGYFQPFAFDVTGHVRPGENHLEVEVTCPKEKPDVLWPNRKRVIKGIFSHWDCRPGSWDLETGQDHNSGGIWNRVYLEVRCAAHLGTVKLNTFLLPDVTEQRGHPDADVTYGGANDPEPRPATDAKIVAAVELVGVEGPGYEVELEIDGHKARRPVCAATGEREVTLIVTLPKARLWWTWDLGEPHLYDAVLRLSYHGKTVDEKVVTFGIRQVWVDGMTGEWRLNGRRLFIRGTNIVPTLWLSEYDEAMISRDIELLKAAHVNAVRVCVHVNRREFYTACDRAGILVWQDFPLQWSYAEDDDFAMEAARQVRHMIRSLYNHPSIAVWTMQNESSFHNKNVLDPILALLGREEDAARYVRPTSLYREHAYPGWYRGTIDDYAKLPGAPLVTEFGGQALPAAEEVRAMRGGDQWPPDFEGLAFHDFQYRQTFEIAKIEMGDSLEEFVANSQRYQAKLIRRAVETYRRHKYDPVGCIFQFMFVDCWPSITWSVVSYHRRPKLGYEILRQVYQPVLLIAEFHRDERSSAAGSPVSSPGDALELRLTLWLVNDLHRDLPRLTYRVELEKDRESRCLASGTVDIAADSVLRLGEVGCSVPTGWADSWRLILTLERSGEVVSRNEYEGWST